jgi:hypothetical protein
MEKLESGVCQKKELSLGPMFVIPFLQSLTNQTEMGLLLVASLGTVGSIKS